MNRVLLLPALAAAMSACTMMGQPMSYTLAKQPAGMALNSSGTVSTKMESGMVMTSANVMGLAPNTYYVAHFHNQGAASTDPCASGGPAIMSSKIVGKTDAAGMLMLSGSAASADVMNATYFNIHTATGAEGTPADGGVACTSVKMNMGM